MRSHSFSLFVLIISATSLSRTFAVEAGPATAKTAAPSETAPQKYKELHLGQSLTIRFPEPTPVVLSKEMEYHQTQALNSARTAKTDQEKGASYVEAAMEWTSCIIEPWGQDRALEIIDEGLRVAEAAPEDRTQLFYCKATALARKYKIYGHNWVKRDQRKEVAEALLRTIYEVNAYEKSHPELAKFNPDKPPYPIWDIKAPPLTDKQNAEVQEWMKLIQPHLKLEHLKQMREWSKDLLIAYYSCPSHDYEELRRLTTEILNNPSLADSLVAASEARGNLR